MAIPSKFSAVLSCKCPRCRKGKMFKKPLYNLIDFNKMYQFCPVCGLKYEVEMGFFWGAMYVSYAFNVGQSFIIGVLTFIFLNDPPPLTYCLVIVAGILLFLPFNFRYARSLMLHYFGGVKYDQRFQSAS